MKSETETPPLIPPLVTPDALNQILVEENRRLTLQNDELKEREQVAKRANDEMRAEVERIQKIGQDVEALFSPSEIGSEGGTWQVRIGRGVAALRAQLAALEAERENWRMSSVCREAKADLAARDALIGELRFALDYVFRNTCGLTARCREITRDLLDRTPKDAGAEVRKYRQDIEAAAGELLLPIPEPGTPMARMMIANRLLHAERDALRKQLAARDALLAEMRAGIEFAAECSEDPTNALRLNSLQERMNALLARTPADAGASARTCLHHTDAERSAAGCPVCAGAEVERLRKERDDLMARKDRLVLECHQNKDEADALRAIFPQILAALGSGACAPDCSVEFLSGIPKEVLLVVGKLRAQLATAAQELAEAKAGQTGYRLACDDQRAAREAAEARAEREMERGREWCRESIKNRKHAEHLERIIRDTGRALHLPPNAELPHNVRREAACFYRQFLAERGAHRHTEIARSAAEARLAAVLGAGRAMEHVLRGIANTEGISDYDGMLAGWDAAETSATNSNLIPVGSKLESSACTRIAERPASAEENDAEFARAVQAFTEPPHPDSVRLAAVVQAGNNMKTQFLAFRQVAGEKAPPITVIQWDEALDAAIDAARNGGAAPVKSGVSA